MVFLSYDRASALCRCQGLCLLQRGAMKEGQLQHQACPGEQGLWPPGGSRPTPAYRGGRRWAREGKGRPRILAGGAGPSGDGAGRNLSQDSAPRRPAGSGEAALHTHHSCSSHADCYHGLRSSPGFNYPVLQSPAGRHWYLISLCLSVLIHKANTSWDCEH